MHDVFDRVAARHPVGLITNGPSDIQRLKLEQSGLTGAVRVGGDLGGARDRQAAAVGLPRTARGHSAPIRRPRSWSGTAGSATSWAACDAGMSAVWIADGRPLPEHRDRVAVVDSVLELESALDRLT